MVNDDRDDASISNEPEQHSVEDILIAFQKSFSRLSYQTQLSRQNQIDLNQPNTASAILSGPVAFDIKMKVNPSTERQHKLFYNPNGAIEINMSGHINPDVGFSPKT